MNTIDVTINYEPVMRDTPGKVVQVNLGSLGEEPEYFALVLVGLKFYTLPTRYLTGVPQQPTPPQEQNNGPDTSKPAA